MDKDYKEYLLRKIAITMNDYTTLNRTEKVDCVLACMLQLLTEIVRES